MYDTLSMAYHKTDGHFKPAEIFSLCNTYSCVCQWSTHFNYAMAPQPCCNGVQRSTVITYSAFKVRWKGFSILLSFDWNFCSQMCSGSDLSQRFDSVYSTFCDQTRVISIQANIYFCIPRFKADTELFSVYQALGILQNSWSTHWHAPAYTTKSSLLC